LKVLFLAIVTGCSGSGISRQSGSDSLLGRSVYSDDTSDSPADKNSNARTFTTKRPTNEMTPDPIEEPAKVNPSPKDAVALEMNPIVDGKIETPKPMEGPAVKKPIPFDGTIGEFDCQTTDLKMMFPNYYDYLDIQPFSDEMGGTYTNLKYVSLYKYSNSPCEFLPSVVSAGKCRFKIWA
jgi:hypothetical protein